MVADEHQAFFPYEPAEVLAGSAALGNPLYLDALREAFGDLSGKRVLDVGCGTGFLAEVACSAGAAEVIGVDVHAPMLVCAQQRARHLGLPIRYRRRDACDLGFADGSFDAVGCHLLLHTLPHPLGALAEMWRVARPGARIVVVEPVEAATLFSSSDVAFCRAASEFVGSFLELAALAGLDFSLGLRLPELLAQTGWEPTSVDGFLHTFWAPPNPHQAAQPDADGPFAAWKRKLRQAARLAGKPHAEVDLPVFTMSIPSDLLTTFSLIIATGRRQADLPGVVDLDKRGFGGKVE